MAMSGTSVVGLVISVILGLILLYVVWAVIARFTLPTGFPPSPMQVPLFGNSLLMKKSDHAGRYMRDYAARHQIKGKSLMFGAVLGIHPTQVCCDVRSVKDSARVCMGRPKRHVSAIWSDGSGIAHGDPPNWTKVRKFATTALKEHHETVGWDNAMETAVDALVKKWNKVSRREHTINPRDYFQHVGLNVISQIFLDYRFPGDEVTRRLIDVLQKRREVEAKFPVDSVPILRCLENAGKLTEIKNAWRAVVMPIFDKHLEGSSEHVDNPRSVVDIMYKLRQEEEEFKDISDHDLFLLSINEHIIGANDPTARTLDWMIVFLIQNKKWQHRLHAHVREICGDEPPRLKNIYKLPLVRAFVIEQLRFLPTTIFSIPHKCQEAGEIGGFPIGKDHLALHNLWAVQHDPKNYPDPEIFDPDRFVDKKFDKTTWIPFGYGKRKCTGAKIAMKLLQLVLANWMYYFYFDTANGQYLNVTSKGLPCQPKYQRIVIKTAEDIGHIEVEFSDDLKEEDDAESG